MTAFPLNTSYKLRDQGELTLKGFFYKNIYKLYQTFQKVNLKKKTRRNMTTQKYLLQIVALSKRIGLI